MGAFSTALVQFFNAFTVLFGALERIARTADNLATVAESASGEYKDKSEIDRKIRLIEANNKLAEAQKSALTLPAPANP